ncbi:hypothetical protein GGF46_005511 [Coemansia sp. RSA 552]|nr:hypothetical protein GGF46_005511 [Coemansia sp. RSA 552]
MSGRGGGSYIPLEEMQGPAELEALSSRDSLSSLNSITSQGDSNSGSNSQGRHRSQSVNSLGSSAQGVLTPRRFQGQTITAHASSTGKLRTLAAVERQRAAHLTHTHSMSDVVQVRESLNDDAMEAGLIGSETTAVEEEPRFGRYRRRANEPIWSRRMLVLPVVMFAAMGLLALTISSLAWVRERRDNPLVDVDAEIFPYAVERSKLAAGQHSLRLIHTNDMHAHFEPFDPETDDACDLSNGTQATKCVGGAAYVKSAVDHLRRGRNVNGDAVLVNAGDEFQGTLYHTLFSGNVSAALLNAFRYDAITLGNHEFDKGPDHLARYLSMVRAPALCANLGFSREMPELQAAVQPFTVIERHNLGIIGVLTPETAASSNLGAGAQLTDPATAVNNARARLAGMGINRVVVLSHLGYDEDKALAARVEPGISLIVGGHTHTLLGGDSKKGPYPTWIPASGAAWQTAVVQAKSFGEYVGYLDLVFNDDGSLDSRLTRGAPVHVTAADGPLRGVAPSAQVAKILRPYADRVAEFRGHRVGSAKAPFPGPDGNRDSHELALGNLVADALVWAQRRAPVALVNTGLLRHGLHSGDITRGDLLRAIPFGGSLVQANLTGAQVREAVRRSLLSNSHEEGWESVLSSAQVSGLRWAPENSVSSIEIRSEIKDFDKRPLSGERWEPLDDKRAYEVLLPQFVAGGGDGLVTPETTRPVADSIAKLVELYVTRFSPLEPIVDHRK